MLGQGPGLQAASDALCFIYLFFFLHLPGILSQTFLRVRANRQTRLNGESGPAPPSAPPPASSLLHCPRLLACLGLFIIGPTDFLAVTASESANRGCRPQFPRLSNGGFQCSARAQASLKARKEPWGTISVGE